MEAARMEVRTYQAQAHTFADYWKSDKLKDEKFNQLIYPVMGLAEEAGEVVGKFAKAYRDCNGEITKERREEIAKELGDVCWFAAEICTNLNLDLESVMEWNIAKLADRRNRNVIHGSGDNR